MTASTTPETAAGDAANVPTTLEPGLRTSIRRRLTWPVLLIGAAVLLALLSVVRILTGQDDVTSGGTISATLQLSIPVGLAGLGGLWSERSGIVNIGLEGMMILGTWCGAFFGLQFGNPWMAAVGGIVGGAVGGLIHAVATVTFGVDHIVSGVAINIIALGIARYLAVIAFTGRGGGATQSPPVPGFHDIGLPGVSGPLKAVEDEHWFFVSDLAGVVRGLTTNLTWLTVIAVALVPLSYFVLWRTSFGLRLRSCGENPVAAESLGVNVYRMKYAAVIVSGGLAGLAGAFLVTVASSIYREGQTGGRGYIGLAAMLFGNWRPGGLAAGAGLFGYSDALQSRQPRAVHALLLFVAIVLVVIAVWNLWRRRTVAGGLALVAAAGFLLWYLFTDSVPGELVAYTPHITTLLVLSLASQRLRMPAADGLPYRRGRAT